MKNDVVVLLKQKAKTRKNGVYSYHSYLYAVKEGEFIAFVNSDGELYGRFGGFNCLVGAVDVLYRKQKLKEFLNESIRQG